MNVEKELKAIDKHIGKQLREKRLRRGYSLACVAAYIDKSYQQMQKYESSQSRVSAPILYKLANFYGMSIDKFFEGLPNNSKELQQASQETKKVINILLVEDDPGDETIARKALSSFRNINVFCVHDGHQTLDVLRYRNVSYDFPRPDLIFLDLVIPKKDGMTILKEIKRDSEIQDIPVIILTNSVDPALMAMAYKSGASGYIRKSFDFFVFKKNMEDCVNYWSKAVILPSGT